MSASDGGRRVVIVDSADELNTNAANAILKLLEEPPEGGAVFLLISHQPTRLLPTIRSRCRELRLTPPLPPPDVLTDALTAAGGAEGDIQTDALGQLAAGSVGEALTLTHLDGLDLYAEICATFAEAPRYDRPPRALKLSTLATGGAANADRYDLILHLFDLFLTRLARTGAGLPPPPPRPRRTRPRSFRACRRVALRPAPGPPHNRSCPPPPNMAAL